MGIKIFKEYLKSHGYRRSSQRDLIVETFLAEKGHQSVETLLARAREKDPRVGMTTVYRTLKLLARCGLAAERKFNSQISHFEPTPEKMHHDHLICLNCGAIMEFTDPGIEALQESVARLMNFRISHHIMELYGTCEKCARDSQNGRAS